MSTEDLVARFCRVCLSSRGVVHKEADVCARAERLRTQLLALPRGTHHLLVEEDDPVDFCLRFLIALEQGHSPLGIGRKLPKHQRDVLADTLSSGWVWTRDAMPVRLTRSEPGSATHASGAAASDLVCNARPGQYACLTSGTTGRPRLHHFSVQGALQNAQAHALSLGLRSSDVLLQSLPLHHGFGLVAYLFTSIQLGCRLDFSPTFRTFRALGAQPLRNSVLHVSPTQLRFMLREPATATADLRIVSVGAGQASPSEFRQLRARVPGAALYVTYGLTEAGPRVSTGRVDPDVLPVGAIGAPIEGVCWAVMSEGGTLRAEGRGRLCVASPMRATEAPTFEGNDGHPWLATRDEVTIDKDGSATFCHRLDDLINVGGISVYGGDVETVVRASPDVIDCAVLVRTDPLYGEVFDLVVQSAASKLREDWLDHLRPEQAPRKTCVVDEIPRTALGKVDRDALRARLEQMG